MAYEEEKLMQQLRQDLVDAKKEIVRLHTCEDDLRTIHEEHMLAVTEAEAHFAYLNGKLFLIPPTIECRWIPVAERLPEHLKMQSEWVHVTDGERVKQAYYYDYTSRKDKPGYATGKGWYGMTNVTHWYPIILPKSERKE